MSPSRPFGLGRAPAPNSAISDAPPSDPTSKPEGKIGDPSPDGDSPITLSAEDVKAAGLDGIGEGDTFTVEVTCRARAVNEDGSIDADVIDASEGEQGTDEPGGDSTEDDEPGDQTGFQRPKGKIELGPGKMKGF
jgi:hypothetical protein